MNTILTADKPRLRREFEAIRQSVSPAERQEADRRLLAHLFDSPAWKAADTVLSYCSVRGEIDLSPVWEKATSEGKRYALPRTLTGAGEGRMIFQYVKTQDDLLPGRYGLLEPSSVCDEVVNFDKTLCIVPGLAFDSQGYRLGYGGGYYDRFLAAQPSIIAVGLCYAVCLCERLPHDHHDVPVSYVISERSVIRCVR